MAGQVTNVRVGSIGVAVTVAMMVGTMLPYAVSVLAPLITLDLGISATQVGMFGTGTMLVATMVAPRAGIAVDRLGARTTMVVLHAAFVVAILVLASSPNTVVFLAGSIAAGLSISLTNPTTNQVIATHVPPGLRGLLIGIKQAGGQLSAVAAGLGLPVLASFWGWRPALLTFIVFAAIGIVSLTGVPRTMRHPVKTGPRPLLEDSDDVALKLRRLRRFGFLVAAGTAPMLYFLPLFMVDEFGVSATLAGSTAALAATTGTIARLSWGPATERIRDPEVALSVIGWTAAGGMLLLAGSTFVAIHLVWPAVVIIGATGLAFTTPAMLAIMRSVSPEATGAASGKFARSAYAGGVISPVTFGYIIDATGSYRTAWGIAAILLAAAAVATRPRNRLLVKEPPAA